jgi:hypothetical protein
MKENGLKARVMDMDHTTSSVVPSTRDNGIKTSKMVLVKSTLEMGLSMKGSLRME